MESHVVNLQDKIQKLIDQYTLDKQKLEELENKVAQLTEENSQLFAQIEASGSQNEMQETTDDMKGENGFIGPAGKTDDGLRPVGWLTWRTDAGRRFGRSRLGRG